MSNQGVNHAWLQQAAQALGACGQVIKTDYSGRTRKFIPIPKSFLYQTIHTANTVATEPLGITGDTVWMLRSMQGQVINPAIYNGFAFQIQTPDGKNIFGSPPSGETLFNAGSQRYLFGAPLYIDPGKRFLMTVDDTAWGNTPTNRNIPIAILFEGAYLYEVQGSGDVTPVLASDLPRYFGNYPSQNILAPEVALQFDQETPAGFIDREFIYSDPNILPQLGTSPIGSPISSIPNGNNTRIIQMQPNSEFFVRRLIFTAEQISGDFNVTIQVKIRDHTGLAYTSDFISIQTKGPSATFLTGLLSDGVLPCNWHLCPAGNAAPALIFEYRIVDAPDTTVFSMQTCVIGVRRIRA